MKSGFHYFDYAATTKPDDSILQDALKFSEEHWGNPSSIYSLGAEAHHALEECRSSCAETLGVKKEQIFFTSGGTESDHLALLSVLMRPQKGSILLSAIEHPALREMISSVESAGWKVIKVNPGRDGHVTPEEIINNLKPDTAFVGVMAVNNETGAVQDIKGISSALEKWAEGKRKPFFHADCVQAAGKIPLDLKSLGVDSAAFSSHKIHGPRGTGILYLKKPFSSFLKGGGQEAGIRSGTENLFGSRAFSEALKKYYIRPANPETIERLELQKKLTANFISSLRKIKNARLIPSERKDYDENFSPWIVQCAFTGIPGQVMLRALDEEGFLISTGSACSSGKNTRPVLDAMHVEPEEKKSSVRFSFGFPTTEEEMNLLLDAVKRICERFE